VDTSVDTVDTWNQFAYGKPICSKFPIFRKFYKRLACKVFLV